MKALELKVPPPVVALISAVLMLGIAKLISSHPIDLPEKDVIALVILAVGLAIGAAGAISFKLAKTTVNPLTPEKASSLVTSGIYRFTRNPMYLGMLIDLVAIGVYLACPFSFILIPIYVLYLNRFQIRPEEQMLFSIFGNSYAAYKSRVLRWV
ncbi:MAG: methyltransferase family protein [Burkholderiaceae bacterium]